MSKRGRDGNILVESRPMLKRCLPFEECTMINKRQCLSDSISFLKKRPAEFDNELEHLHKRLRASVPTAEETFAYIIPHVRRLRNLYCASQEENTALKKHLATMKQAYQASIQHIGSLSRQLDASKAEVAELQRQVEMMRYRLALSECKSKNESMKI